MSVWSGPCAPRPMSSSCSMAHSEAASRCTLNWVLTRLFSLSARVKFTVRFYDLGEFPGLVLESGRVVAELFKIRDTSVLPRLDKYEVYDPAKPKQSLFRRTAIQLPRYRSWIANKLHGHPTIDAWIYVYNQPIGGKHKIEERSWLDYKRKRQTRSGE
jgi:gamma-glutamylcyclotransferase (GGCT)/AIG2-like uncharacterized protein YtfP